MYAIQKDLCRLFDLCDVDKIGTISSMTVNNLLSFIQAKIRVTTSQTRESFIDLGLQLMIIREIKSDSLTLTEVIESFEKLDVDSNGCISFDDVKAFMSKVGLSPSDDEIFQFYSQLDINRSGCVCFSDYLEATSPRK